MSLHEGDTPALLKITYIYEPEHKQLRMPNIMMYIKSTHLPEEFIYDPDSYFNISQSNVVDPILEANNVTREMIREYQEYLLYEKILPDWFDGNAGKTKHSIDTLGEFTIVDNTFAELGEDWGK